MELIENKKRGDLGKPRSLFVSRSKLVSSFLGYAPQTKTKKYFK